MKHQQLKWLVLVLVIFLPRLLNLDQFLTADEPLFLEHAQAFAAGVSSGDFAQTLGIGYPGVTVAAWAAPWVTGREESLATYAAGRFAVGLLNGGLVLALIALAGRLLGSQAAWLAGLLLALDPFLLGYSRLLHIEAVLATLMTLAAVSLLLWLQHERWLYLWLTSLFVSLALLTKSTALLLGPMLAALLVAWAGATGKWTKPAWWRGQLSALALALPITLFLFYLLWPAMWVDPMAALGLSFGKLVVDQEAGTGNLGMFWLGRFVEDPGPFFYPVAFLLKATPWLLAGLAFSLFYLFRAEEGNETEGSPPRMKARGDTPQAPRPAAPFTIALPLWLFALTYLLLMTVASKKAVRYLLPAFPVFYLLAGSALYYFYLSMRRGAWGAGRRRFTPPGQLVINNEQLISSSAQSSNPPILQPSNPSTPLRASLPPFHPSNLPSFQSSIPSASLRTGLPILLTFFLLILTFIYHPYYLTYYNPAILGWRWAPQTLLVGWGEGLDGAARYLNHQPLRTVSAWYEWLFPVMYDGQVEAVVPQENLLTADRSVLYLNQVQRDIPSPNIIYYFRSRRIPEQTVRLNGIDYAWVYPGPIAGFQPPPPPHSPLSGEFGDEVRLLGYNLSMPAPRSGESLVVTLFWEILLTPPTDRFVFLRLVDTQGYIWASADSPPVMGLWPVERWRSGMFIEDAQVLPIPAGTPPGTYRLEIGLYDPINGQPLAARDQPVGQGGGLLLGQVPVEWRDLPDLEVQLPHQTNTRLSAAASLIGFDSLPATATTGDVLALNLAWRKSRSWLNEDNFPANYVQFTWYREGTYLAEQLEPLPLPVEQWGQGAVLRSQYGVIVPPTLESGRYDLHLALHTGSEPAGAPFRLGQVEVAAPSHAFELPVAASTPAGPAQLSAGDATIGLAGYTLARNGDQLNLHLFWQTDLPLAARYRIFVQILTDDGALVAQSDADPAGGLRPTTGWLPGEIITDSHSLTLPLDPPAPYRLIAGLYDPRSGQRLTLLEPTGQPVPDAIFITDEQLTLNN